MRGSGKRDSVRQDIRAVGFNRPDMGSVDLSAAATVDELQAGDCASFDDGTAGEILGTDGAIGGAGGVEKGAGSGVNEKDKKLHREAQSGEHRVHRETGTIREALLICE